MSVDGKIVAIGQVNNKKRTQKSRCESCLVNKSQINFTHAGGAAAAADASLCVQTSSCHIKPLSLNIQVG